MPKHLQKEFEKFHEAIKLVEGTENAKLREKRDLLLSELKAGLKEKFGDKDPNVHKFEWFNQGSYWMETGVKPLDGDYDIDIGLRFQFAKTAYEPVKVKEWVRDALASGNRTVEMKRSCVRVQYHKNGNKDYHVDLAVYCKDPASNAWDKKTYLAKGYSGSTSENKKWEEADPDKLKASMDGKFSDKEDERQFLRVIRYLKRWKDFQFKTDGNAAPTGIAITAIALSHFTCQKSREWTGTEYRYLYDDLLAKYHLVAAFLSQFQQKYSFTEGWFWDITVKLPVMPYNDLFEKMSYKQKANLKSKLEALKTDLDPMRSGNRDAKKDAETLKKQFGDDFPLP